MIIIANGPRFVNWQSGDEIFVEKEENRMLFLFLDCDLDDESKNKLRTDVKERTGEDSLILGPSFLKVCQFPVKKERAASPKKKLPWLFRT